MHEKLFHPQAMLQQLKENLNKKRNKVFTVADWDSWVSAASFIIDTLDKITNDLEQEFTAHGQNQSTVDYHGGPQLVNFKPNPGAQGQGAHSSRDGSNQQHGSGPSRHHHESKSMENVTRNAQRENTGDDTESSQGKQEQGQTKKEGK